MSSAEFIVPPPFGTVGDYSQDQNYALGSTIVFEWSGSTATTQGMNLWLKQDREGFTCTTLNLANTLCWLIYENVDTTSYGWYVSIPEFNGQNYDQNFPYYWIHMYDSQNTFGGVFGSHYFNVLPSSLMPASATLTGYGGASATATSTPTSSTSTAPAVTMTSGGNGQSSSSATTLSTTSTQVSTSITGLSPSISGSSTSLSSSGTMSTSSSTGSPSSSSQSATAAASSSGLTSTTKLALGVGLGVGIPLILILAAIAFLLYRNNKEKHNPGPTAAMAEHGQFNAPPRYEAPAGVKESWQQPQRPHELHGNNFRITNPSELDAHPYR